MLGRIYCTGTSEDYAAVHALQDQITATPLSSFSKPYTAPPGRVNPAIDVSNLSMSGSRHGHQRLLESARLLMRDNPPAAEDGPILKKMARLGLAPGKPFAIAGLEPDIIQVLQYVPISAHTRMRLAETGCENESCRLVLRRWLEMDAEDGDLWCGLPRNAPQSPPSLAERLCHRMFSSRARPQTASASPTVGTSDTPCGSPPAQGHHRQRLLVAHHVRR